MAPKATRRQSGNKTKLLPFSERGGKLLTLDEAANLCGVIPRQMRKLVDTGEIPKIKMGGLVRVHIDDVNAYIDRQRGVAS